MKIAIVTQYEDMKVHFNRWANEENEIDWRKDFYRGTRCTVAYAASELRGFLYAFLIDTEIVFCSVPQDGINIYLITEHEYGKEGEYSLIPCENGIKIIGKTRVGVLYGVYELLKLQGYRWFTQNEQHTPQKTKHLTLPKKEEHFKPAMDIMRGFDLEGLVPGVAMWKYMARNRLNGARPEVGSIGFQQKVGMILKDGGHFFHTFLSPNSILPEGKTIWELHPEWYGVRADGTPVTPQNALQTQFCVSNDEVCAYFSAEIIRRLQHEWKDAERLDIWGFDTWGNTCACERCRALGNSTDQTLHLLSKLRDAINSAGLGRKVELVLCAYGGTSTLEPPIHSIPENLIEAGDMITFYPITRCYRHHIDASPCAENEYFHRCIQGWLDKKPAMPMIMGEYYNVSKWEELPVVLTETMCYDIPRYVEFGIRGITYMHVPLANWSVKALTQWLYSNLSWNPKLDKEALINDYFEKRYHENAEVMKRVYVKLEEAWRDIQTWRSWAPESILSQFLVWNGGIPHKELDTRGHYKNHADIIEKGNYYLGLMQEAAEEIKGLKRQYFDNLPEMKEIRLARNPGELIGLRMPDPEDFKLGEDLRFVSYGIDVMSLMVATVEYYDALYAGKASNEIWKRIVEIYDKLESYFTCADRSTFENGGDTIDGLKRSQMGRMVRLCASYRKNHPELK